MKHAVLPFITDPVERSKCVGRVHRDGSITFRGRTYPTIKAVPPECRFFRADVDAFTQWAKLYRAIDPRRKRP